MSAVEAGNQATGSEDKKTQRVVEGRLGHDRHGPPQCLHTALRMVEVVVLEHRTDRELEHRHPRRHQIPHRRVALGLPQVTGVHPGRGHGDDEGDLPAFIGLRAQGYDFGRRIERRRFVVKAVAT